MAIIGGDQGKAGESKGSGRKADDLRLSCLCLLLTCATLKKITFSDIFVLEVFEHAMSSSAGRLD